MGQISLPDLFSSVGLAYRNFILPPKSIFSTKQGLLLNYLVLCFVFVMSLMLIVRLFRKSIAFGGTALLLLLLFPIAINFIFVMSSEVHSLMLFAINLLFIYLIWLSEKICFKNVRIDKCVGVGIALCLFAMSTTNIYISNECFLKADNIKNRLASKNYTTLVTRITSTEGYKDSYPVAMINIENFHDDSWRDIEKLNLKAMVYGRDSQIFLSMETDGQ